MSKFSLIFITLLLGFMNIKPVPAETKVSAALSKSSSGYSKALEPREFKFPRDHLAHDDFKTEWWYFTGNLDSENGDHYGYQLTIFRNAISPETTKTNKNSKWNSKQIYMGHLAITDVKNKKFYSFERFDRNALGLAGTKEKAPETIFLNDWNISFEESSSKPIINIYARELDESGEEVSLKLKLKATKPIVLQGDKGLSQKSSGLGNASYYYSSTQMESSGFIKTQSKLKKVTGLSWMDREWSTSSLAEDQAGWDWFSLQLDDNHELMYYQLRNKDDSIDSHSKGSWILANSQNKTFSSDEIELKVLEYWTSTDSKIKYPSSWELNIPKFNLKFKVKPYINNQEHNFTFKYWEGAVKVSGTRNGKSVSGQGYVELTGY